MDVTKFHLKAGTTTYHLELTTPTGVVKYTGSSEGNPKFNDVTGLFTNKWFVEINGSSVKASPDLTITFKDENGTHELIIRWNPLTNQFQYEWFKDLWVDIHQFQFNKDNNKTFLFINYDKVYDITIDNLRIIKLGIIENLAKFNFWVAKYTENVILERPESPKPKGNTLLLPSDFVELSSEKQLEFIYVYELEVRRNYDETFSFILTRRAWENKVRFELMDVYGFHILTATMGHSSQHIRLKIKLYTASGNVDFISKENCLKATVINSLARLNGLFKYYWVVEKDKYQYEMKAFRQDRFTNVQVGYDKFKNLFVCYYANTFQFNYRGKWEAIKHLIGVSLTKSNIC
jgi:hypothetical protein